MKLLSFDEENNVNEMVVYIFFLFVLKAMSAISVY
jgi:hypothetical protein